MDLGFALPISGSWATADNMVEIARSAEDLGYRSVWTFQRLLYPATGDPIPAVYAAVHDPLIPLAYVAADTTRVRLGAAIVNMPFVSPVLLAKQLTSIDIVSDGRLIAGLGLGWSPIEFAASNAPMERRGARGDEFLRCLYAIWTDDVVDFAGEFYTAPPSRIAPKPVQQPRPPVVLGGFAPSALRRVGRLADGWVSGSAANFDVVRDAIRTIRETADEAGRDADALEYVVRGVVRVRPGGAADRRMLSGSLDEIRADLADLASAGVTEVFVDLNFDEEIGTPDADGAHSMDRAREVMQELASGT